MGFAARYDLAHRNIGFDFYAWQTHVVILGAAEIVFGVKSFGQRYISDAECRQRYESIIKPGPAFLGLPSREGDDGEERGTHKFSGIMATGSLDFPRLRSVLPPRDKRYTVTLRNAPKHPSHNSDQKVWRRFAKEIGAYVIEDWHDQAIDLHKRMALYAGARMNFGVVNGPMGMLMFSGYPMMMCSCVTAEINWKKHGIGRGEQPPWFLPGQSLMWAEPSFPALMREVEKIERAC